MVERTVCDSCSAPTTPGYAFFPSCGAAVTTTTPAVKVTLPEPAGEETAEPVAAYGAA